MVKIFIKFLTGTQEWIKSLGGNGGDYFESIAPSYNSDGMVDGYIAAGYSDSTDALFTNKGNNDAIIVKFY